MVILLMKAIVRKALYWIVRMLHRIQGLDFIEKDTSVCSNTNNGYGFTDWMQIRQIVNFIRNQKLDDYMSSIIDVGCGKGYVLSRFARMQGTKVTGIESEHHLVEVAQSNFSKMGIQERIQIIHDDAIHYEDYSKYSLVFMYNPFPHLIMKSFLNNLLSKKKGQSYLIVYVHPNLHEEIMNTGEFTLLVSLYNKLRSQRTNIYIHSHDS